MLLQLSLIYSMTQISDNQAMQKQSLMEIEIDQIFKDFQNEIFYESIDLAESSGWMMELPSGKTVSRSFLMSQADTLITYRYEAVPGIAKWVMDEQLYIRYIAVYALQQITGLSPYIAYFDKKDKEGNRQKAIETWMAWWKDQK